MSTWAEHDEICPTLGGPMLDYVNYPNFGSVGGVGGNPLKFRTTGSLTWEFHHWSAGWTVRYFDGYRQSGAPGDPGGTSTFTTAAQGSSVIPSQIYHDVFMGYYFGKGAGTAGTSRMSRLLNGLSIQVGIRDVFNKAPPFDAFGNWAPAYESQFGDIRL